MTTEELIAKVRAAEEAAERNVAVFEQLSTDDFQIGGFFVGLHEFISAQGTLRAAKMNLRELLAKLEAHHKETR